MKKIKFCAALTGGLILLNACNRPAPQTPQPRILAQIADINYFGETQRLENGQTVQTLYKLTPSGSKSYVIPPEYAIDSICFYGGHFFGAYKNGLIRVYNNEGHKLFKNDYRSVSLQDSLFSLFDGKKFFIGLCDEYLTGSPGKYIDAGPYDSLCIGKNREIFYKQDSCWSAFKTNSQMSLPGRCRQIICIDSRKDNKNYYLVQDERKRWLLRDHSGQSLRIPTSAQLQQLLEVEPVWQCGSIRGISVEYLAP